MRKLILLLALFFTAPLAAEPTEEQYREDAQSMIAMINSDYGYLERFADGQLPVGDTMKAEAAAVTDAKSLLQFAERLLFLMRDHHAITGSSFSNSWGLVPTFVDVWIVHKDGRYLVDAVRRGSPAENAGVVAGMALLRVGDLDTGTAVERFYNDLGLDARGDETMAFAARVLTAGRRDRPRNLTFGGAAGAVSMELPNLYAIEREDLPPVTATRDGDALVVRFNDSLGNGDTVAAFDTAMAKMGDASRVILDLTETPSGGDTSVARGVMGWFTAEPALYQVHSLPAEKRETGIARQWAEYVLPREGKYFGGEVEVHVGRWTGSMGEGMAIGMRALGAELAGHEMAGLLGAVYDYRLPHSGFLFKLPVERLYSVDGTPREDTLIE